MREMECPLHAGGKTYDSEFIMAELLRRNLRLSPENFPETSPDYEKDAMEKGKSTSMEDATRKEALHTVEKAAPGDSKDPEEQISEDPSLLGIAKREEEVDESSKWQGQWSLNNLLHGGRPLHEVGNELSPRGRSSEMKILRYDLESSNRVIDVLKKQIEERDDTITKLLTHVNMLEEWKDELDISRMALAKEQKLELESMISVTNEKYQRKIAECETYSKRLLQMDQELMTKDNELRSLQIKVNDLTMENSKLSRRVKELEAEKEIKDSSTERLRESFQERQLNMQIILDREYQDQAQRLLDKVEAEKQRAVAKEKELRESMILLQRAEKECKKLLAATVNLKKEVEARDEEIKWLTESILNLEQNAFKHEQNTSARISTAQSMLEDLRREKSLLKSKNRELKQELVKFRGITCESNLRSTDDQSI